MLRLLFSSLVVFLLITSIIGMILAIVAPYLEYHRNVFAQDIYNLLSFLCHQIPSRCFWAWDSNMGLCSRCFSLYTSFSLCMIVLLYSNVYKRLKKNFMLYQGIILLIPLLVDGSLGTATNYISNNFIRSVTGALFGIGFGLILFIKRGEI